MSEEQDLNPSQSPFVESFEPTSALPGSRIALHVHGQNFGEGSRVDLLLSGEVTDEVQTLSTQFVTPEELVADISITNNAPVRDYSVQVTTSDGKRGIPIEGFEVAGAGSLQVTVATTGQVGMDPNGYTVTVDDSSRFLHVNDTVTFEPLAAGPHTVRIEDVNEHCSVAGENPRIVTVVGGIVAQTSFTITCPVLGGEIAGRIAFTGDEGGNTEIFVSNSDGAGIFNVTHHPAADWGPALSRDRSRIVFNSDRDDPAGDLYSVNADGSGLVRLTDSPGADWVGSQAWSPDGSRIVFTSMRDDPQGDIYVMTADGSGVTRLTQEEGWDGDAAWSPDGASIAFTGHGRTDDDRERGDVIYRMSAVDGSGVTKVFIYGFNPVWSPDGSRLAFTSEWDVLPRRDQLAVIGIDGTGLVIFEWPDTHAFWPSWSPDGSWIAFAMRDPSLSQTLSIMIVPFEVISGFGEMKELIHGGYAEPSWR